jgi:hypothetical protein
MPSKLTVLCGMRHQQISVRVPFLDCISGQVVDLWNLARIAKSGSKKQGKHGDLHVRCNFVSLSLCSFLTLNSCLEDLLTELVSDCLSHVQSKDFAEPTLTS